MIILDNALRFAPKGSEVRLTMDQNSLSVQDAGPGIPEDSLPRVFERFYRVPGGERAPAPARAWPSLGKSPSATACKSPPPTGERAGRCSVSAGLKMQFCD